MSNNQFEFLDWIVEKIKESSRFVIYSHEFSDEIRSKMESLSVLVGNHGYFRYKSTFYYVGRVHYDYSYSMFVQIEANMPEKFMDFDQKKKSRNNYVFGVLINENKVSEINIAKYVLRLSNLHKKRHSEEPHFLEWENSSNNIRIFLGDERDIKDYAIEHGGERIEDKNRKIFALALGVNEKESLDILLSKFRELK